MDHLTNKKTCWFMYIGRRTIATHRAKAVSEFVKMQFGMCPTSSLKTQDTNKFGFFCHCFLILCALTYMPFAPLHSWVEFCLKDMSLSLTPAVSQNSNQPTDSAPFTSQHPRHHFKWLPSLQPVNILEKPLFVTTTTKGIPETGNKYCQILAELMRLI